MIEPDLVIFDCDGVLIDSELIGARVEAALLGRIGIRVAEGEILTRFLGMSAQAMYRALETEHRRALPEGFAAAVQAEIDAAFERDLQVIPGFTRRSTGCGRPAASRPAARSRGSATASG